MADPCDNIKKGWKKKRLIKLMVFILMMWDILLFEGYVTSHNSKAEACMLECLQWEKWRHTSPGFGLFYHRQH